MVSNDKGDEYLCVCGKVFRRQLALERHVDIHHSSKSVSRKCDVCGKTFGSRNTLTMHRAIHAQSTEQQGSQYFERVSSGSENPTELSDSVQGQGVNETSPTVQLVYVVSASQDEKEETADETCKLIETQATDDAQSGGTYRANEDKPISDISSSIGSFILDSAPNNTEHIEEQKEPSAGGIRVSAVVARLRKQSFPSNVFETNYETDQSIDFSHMVVEEIVSESLLQTANQLPESLAAQHWSKSDQCLNLSVSDDPTSNEAKCQNVESPDLLQKRINKVKPETRKSQEKLRQSRNSEEKRVDVELVEEFEGGDYGQKEAISLATTRQLHGSRTPFICGICHKNFDSEKYLSMHMPLHKPYLDPLTVDGKLATRTSLEIQELTDIHGQSVTKQKKTTTTDAQHWTCQYCNKLFMQNSNYKNHMRTHSDERPFVCEICNIGFKERYHLKKHVLFKHTTDLKEKCRVCGKCFKDSTAVRAHERIHSEIRPYSCQLCWKTFKTSECLWHHENRSKTCGKSVMRRVDATNSPPSSSAAAVLPDRSDIAPMRRTRKPRLGVGVASKVRTPRRGPMVSALDDNSQTKHYTGVIDDKMNSEIVTSVLAIKAEPECDMFDPSLQTYINDDQELESILEIFGGNANKDVSCAEETGSDLTDSDNGFVARDSEDFSAKYRGLECTKCVKKFSSTATFEKHMVMHNEERPYRCTLCDNGFKLKVHLKKHHLYRHSNEYPCECSICGKRFKDSSAVRLHEKIHSSDRPFRCHCGKGFKTRENLWGHRNRGPCEKTQDFIANNIGLFRTTEFGPILGVPITNGHSLVASSNMAAPFTTSSFTNTSGATSDVNQVQVQTGMQPVLLKATQGRLNMPHSMQFIPSCVISTPDVSAGHTSRQLKVATLKFIKPRSNDALTQQTSMIPTAIVTPLVRDGMAPSASSHPGNQIHNQSTAKTVASKNTSQLQSVDSRADLLPCHTHSSASSLTFTRTRKPKNVVTDTAHILSAADKCPTVQKFLEMDCITKSPGINHLLGNPMVLQHRCDSDSITITPKRRKLNSIGDDNSSTEGEDKASSSRHEDRASIVCADSIGLIEQESQDSRSLSYIDPLLTNSPHSSSHLSIYPGVDDYDDMKYDPNDPMLNIDVYWGDSDNTLSSGWLLENDSLFSDLSLPSTFDTL